MLNTQKLHVPTKMTSQRFSQPWLTQECKRASRKKKIRYNRFKLTGDPHDWKNFQECSRSCNKLYTRTKNTFVKNSVDGDKKKLFKYIKSKRKDIVGVAPLVDDYGQLQSDDKTIAEILNKQYCSVFSIDDGKTPLIKDKKGKSINKITVTRNGIFKLLNDLSPTKASGPDGVAFRLLMECAEQVADSFVLLFNASLKQETIPDDWKHALVTPIHKGNNKSKSQAENDRPVSLTSITCKLLEHVIHSHVINHLE